MRLIKLIPVQIIFLIPIIQHVYEGIKYHEIFSGGRPALLWWNPILSFIMLVAGIYIRVLLIGPIWFMVLFVPVAVITMMVVYVLFYPTPVDPEIGLILWQKAIWIGAINGFITGAIVQWCVFHDPDLKN